MTGSHGHSHAGGGGGGHGHSHGGKKEKHGHKHGHKDKHGHKHGHKDKHEHKEKKHKDKKHKYEHVDDHDRLSEHDIVSVNAETLEIKYKEDMNIRAVFLHYLGDAISSLFVLAAGLILHYFPDEKWAVYVDPASRYFEHLISVTV